MKDYNRSLKRFFETTNPIPIKAALEQLGWEVGPPRPPLVKLNDDKTQKLSILINKLFEN